MIKKNNLLNYNISELYSIFEQEGLKSFRTDQIFDWIYKKKVLDFEKMSNLSKNLRDTLAKKYSLFIPEIDLQMDSIDGTSKYRLKLFDGQKIEMVIIPNEEKDKNTLCISSQAGCARNCRFCATAKLGLLRNLEVSEIVGQVLAAQKILSDKLTNIVFMGMGEPLDNFDNVVKSIKILQHDKGLKFSPRRVTISTCGIVSKIKKLNSTGLKFKLAVSLNAADNLKRSQIMPVNNKFRLEDLKKALKEYQKDTPHRITFEYIAIDNFNMSESDILNLKSFTSGLSCKINLIPWNPVKNSNFKSPSYKKLVNFQNKIKSQINKTVTIRNSRGEDISAACGQLITKKRS